MIIEFLSSDNTASRNCKLLESFFSSFLDLNFFSKIFPFSVKIKTPFSSLLNIDIFGIEFILTESINLFELKLQTLTIESLEQVVNRLPFLENFMLLIED